MQKNNYIAPEWKDVFIEAGYPDFDAWWRADGELVEEGNYWGRDKNTSWSHVTRVKLPDNRTVYLKRQQNHRPGNAIHWLLGRLTFDLEWRNSQTLKKLGIPCPNYIYFTNQKLGFRKNRCILISEELTGMIALEDLYNYFIKHGFPPRKVRYEILSAIAKISKQLHEAGLLHGALKPRHLFITSSFDAEGNWVQPDTFSACFIDLERMKHVGPNSPRLVSKDLRIISSKLRQWPRKDFVWFIKQYLGISKLTPQAKSIIRLLARINNF